MTHHMRWESDKRDLSGAILLVGLMCLLVTLPARATGAETVVPQTLFELTYGEGEDQIGVVRGDEPGTYPMGPTSLTIGPSGDVYIGDRIQQTVKRFSRSGKLLMKTEGEIENMGRPCIGPKGEIWVVNGAGATELTLFDPEGRRVVSTRDEKGVLVEPRGGEQVLEQMRAWMVAHSLFPQINPTSLSYDASGRFYVRVSGYNFEPKVAGARPRVFVFTPDLTLSGVVLGDFVGPQGMLYSATGPPMNRVGQRYQVRAHNGSLLEEVDLPRSEALAEVVPWMGGDTASLSYTMADARGDLYAVGLVSRSAIGETSRFLTEDLVVDLDLAILKLDATGRLLAAFRIPGSPFLRVYSVYVGPKGDTYYFEFGPESLKVKMISAAALSAAAAKSPSKIIAVHP